MSTAESKNYYELLGIQPDATKDQIKTAYKEIARVFHPDSNFYDEILGDIAELQGDDELFKLITQAYNVLVNEQQRADYDRTIPKGLRSWDDDEPTFQKEHSMHKQMQRDMAGHSHVGRPHTFGTFGVMNQQPSAFDLGSEPPPVSEVIHLKSRSGFFGFLTRLLGGR